MKHFYYLFSIFSFAFLFLTLSSYQPPETGLFLGQKFQDSSVKKTCNFKKRIDLIKERKGDGSVSNVFSVKNLSQFLYLATKAPKPLILYFYSNSNNFKLEYQKIADKFQDRALFLSVDMSKKTHLSTVIFSFLRFAGIVSNLNENNFPIFTFCDRAAISFINKNISLKKGALRLLFKPQDSNVDGLIINLKKELNLKSPEPENESFFQKFGSWFKSNFLD